MSTLKDVLAEKVPGRQADLAKLRKEHGHKSVGEVCAARPIHTITSMVVRTILPQTALPDLKAPCTEGAMGGCQRVSGANLWPDL